jgi:glycosyltransferase involved in cell wall biosynthesis
VKVVLYAGRMDAGKNVEGVLAALSHLGDAVPFVAVICGDGPRRPRLERMACEMGIAHRTVFKGYVDNLWELLRRADAFVSLSRFEGCPNVVLEAMACGCPLIVSDIPAHREMLDERSARAPTLLSSGRVSTSPRWRPATRRWPSCRRGTSSRERGSTSRPTPSSPPAHCPSSPSCCSA